MRRLVLVPLLAVALVAAGCSTSKPGEKTARPLPTGKVTGVKKQQAAGVPAKYKNGDATAGKAVFASSGCSGCHTLKAAGASGTVGPNLDQVKPPLSRVVTQVLNGGAVMPPFKGKLSDKQIADVAAFVVKSTGGNPNG